MPWTPLKAPRLATATQADWDRFAGEVDSRIRAAESHKTLPIRDDLPKGSRLTLEVGTTLVVAPGTGETVTVVLPTLSPGDEGRLSAIARLSSTGILKLVAPPGYLLNGVASLNLATYQRMTLLQCWRGHWKAVGNL